MWFYNRLNIKKNAQGTNWMGYCPFLALGCDTTSGVMTGRVWCAQQARKIARDSACVRARQAFPWPQVMTSILCRD